jgi:hypothetical protein
MVRIDLDFIDKPFKSVRGAVNRGMAVWRCIL